MKKNFFFNLAAVAYLLPFLFFAGIQTHNIMTRDEYSNFSPTLGKLPRRAIDT